MRDPVKREHELLELLPTSARSAFEDARKAGSDRAVRDERLQAAFEAVSFPGDYGAFADLSDAQRALVELLARDRSLGVPLYVSVPYGDSLRRWAGVDPPGVLEQDVSHQGRPCARWRALKAGAPVADVVGDLGIADQLELLEHARDYEIDLEDWEPNLTTLQGEGRAWALRYLGEQKSLNRVHVRVPLMPLFLSLVRGKVAIEERWDGLLPTIGRGPLTDLHRECIDAIPPARRAAAIVHALAAHEALAALFVVLDAYPMPELLTKMFDTYDSLADRLTAEEKKRLQALAAAHTELAPVIAARVRESKNRKRPKLVFEPVPFSRKALTPLQKKQLEWVDREKLEWKLVELFIVRDDKGVHRYDVALHAREDGVVYRAKTAKREASFAQGGADGPKEALCDALDDGLAAIRSQSAR